MGKQFKAPVKSGDARDRAPIAPLRERRERAQCSTVPASGLGGSDKQPSELDPLSRMRAKTGSGTRAAVTEDDNARHQRREVCETLPAPPDPENTDDVDPISGAKSY